MGSRSSSAITLASSANQYLSATGPSDNRTPRWGKRKPVGDETVQQCFVEVIAEAPDLPCAHHLHPKHGIRADQPRKRKHRDLHPYIVKIQTFVSHRTTNPEHPPHRLPGKVGPRDFGDAWKAT